MKTIEWQRTGGNTHRVVVRDDVLVRETIEVPAGGSITIEVVSAGGGGGGNTGFFVPDGHRYVTPRGGEGPLKLVK